MCMDNEELMEVAEKDIRCYKYLDKVVHYDPQGKKVVTLKRPYQSFPVKPGLQKAKNFPRSVKSQDHILGGFYALLYKKDAMERCKFDDRKCVTCIVPKGTRIIRGMQGTVEKINALRAEFMILQI